MDPLEAAAQDEASQAPSGGTLGEPYEVAPGVLVRDCWRRNDAGGEDRNGEEVAVPVLGWRRNLRYGNTAPLYLALAGCATAQEADAAVWRWLTGNDQP
jgi:hypothetical protein